MKGFEQLGALGLGYGNGVCLSGLVPRPPRCIFLHRQVMNTGARRLELLLQRSDVFARVGRWLQLRISSCKMRISKLGAPAARWRCGCASCIRNAAFSLRSLVSSACSCRLGCGFGFGFGPGLRLTVASPVRELSRSMLK